MVANYTYPHLEQLARAVAAYKEEYKIEKVSPYLQEYNPLHVIAANPSYIPLIDNKKVETLRVTIP